MPPLRIDTPRLLLRPLGEGDGALYAQLYGDTDVMRHIAPPMAPAVAAASFETACRIQAEQPVFPPRWIVVRRDGGAGIGLMGLIAGGDAGAAIQGHGGSRSVGTRSENSGNGSSGAVEIGIMLLAEAQGRALAREAMAAAVQAVFERGWARSLWARYAPANAAMARVFDSLCFDVATPDATGCRREMTAERWQRLRDAQPGWRALNAIRAGGEGAVGLP